MTKRFIKWIRAGISEISYLVCIDDQIGNDRGVTYDPLCKGLRALLGAS